VVLNGQAECLTLASRLVVLTQFGMVVVCTWTVPIELLLTAWDSPIRKARDEPFLIRWVVCRGYKKPIYQS